MESHAVHWQEGLYTEHRAAFVLICVDSVFKMAARVIPLPFQHVFAFSSVYE